MFSRRPSASSDSETEQWLALMYLHPIGVICFTIIWSWSLAVVHRFHSNAPVASSASKPKITRIAPLPETTNDPVAPVPPSMHCWKCNYYEPPDPPKDIPNAATPQFFCKNVKCAVLQPMQRPPPNHFALLFPERFPRLDDTLAQSGFEIDLIELKQRFRLQQMLHPDNFSTKSLEERTLSEEQSTLVNKAYQVLRDPLFRAQYLLQIHGIVFEESISTDNSGFLLEIMEIQEEVEDAENDTSKLATFRTESRMATVEKQIASYFNKRDLEGAKLSVIQMQYLRTIDTLIKEKE
ncbi:Fe-S protein assembly co-chaperone HscB [Batrachochytrium salamandrivorans]|nr:Fe-S protein assembly co-chaperone HscB [Batrachochytrium salamandrivorans]